MSELEIREYLEKIIINTSFHAVTDEVSRNKETYDKSFSEKALDGCELLLNNCHGLSPLAEKIFKFEIESGLIRLKDELKLSISVNSKKKGAPSIHPNIGALLYIILVNFQFNVGVDTKAERALKRRILDYVKEIIKPQGVLKEYFLKGNFWLGHDPNYLFDSLKLPMCNSEKQWEKGLKNGLKRAYAENYGFSKEEMNSKRFENHIKNNLVETFVDNNARIQRDLDYYSIIKNKMK